jgi:hypothetical protein
MGSRALGERCRLASSAGSSLAPPPDHPLPGQGGKWVQCGAGFTGVRPHLQRDCMKVIDGQRPNVITNRNRTRLPRTPTPARSWIVITLF